METNEKTAQKYPDGSIVTVNGSPWTVETMICRDGEGLLPGQVDRGEDYNLYRLTRHNAKSILRWQHELDNELELYRWTDANGISDFETGYSLEEATEKVRAQIGRDVTVELAKDREPSKDEFWIF